MLHYPKHVRVLFENSKAFAQTEQFHWAQTTRSTLFSQHQRFVVEVGSKVFIVLTKKKKEKKKKNMLVLTMCFY
jgi:hypothetical protein